MQGPEKVPSLPVTSEGPPDHTAALEKEANTNSSAHSDRSASSTVSPSEAPSRQGSIDVEVARANNGDPPPYPPAVKVPRSQRRGFLGRFAVLAEVENSQHFSRRKKWFITFVVALCGVAAPFASGIILPALTPIKNEFNTTPFIANLSVSFYMLAMAIFPLWWSAFSEQFGRRTIYVISYALFILFSVLSAVSTSIGMFIAMRLLNGGASASVQAVGAGTIADIWEPRERGKAMGLFYLGPLCGPLLAPIVGGALTEGLGWRSTMWFLTIYGVIVLIFVVFALPETIMMKKKPIDEAVMEVESNAGRPALTRTSTAQSLAANTTKYVKWFRIVLIDPLRVIAYLRFPAVALTVYYASVTFGALYMLNISLEYTFSRAPYNFSTLVTGFVYFPGSFGYLVSSIFGGAWMDKIMRREAIKAKRYDAEGHLVYYPEDRMRENAWLGATMYPLALLWYGWTADKGVMWVGVLFAPFFFGIGTMIIFSMATTMLTEFMPKKSSSGVAINNLMRNICSCIGSLVAAPLIHAIGNGWVFTIVALWTLSSMVVIWAIRHYGPRWRIAMDEKLK